MLGGSAFRLKLGQQLHLQKLKLTLVDVFTLNVSRCKLLLGRGKGHAVRLTTFEDFHLVLVVRALALVASGHMAT